jgi:hypothetical protein
MAATNSACCKSVREETKIMGRNQHYFINGKESTRWSSHETRNFDKIKGRLSLKNCVLPGRRQKKTYMHVACTYYATIKSISPNPLEKLHTVTSHTL